MGLKVLIVPKPFLFWQILIWVSLISKNKEYLNWENPNGYNLNLPLYEASTWILTMKQEEVGHLFPICPTGIVELKFYLLEDLS